LVVVAVVALVLVLVEWFQRSAPDRGQEVVAATATAAMDVAATVLPGHHQRGRRRRRLFRMKILPFQNVVGQRDNRGRR